MDFKYVYVYVAVTGKNTRRIEMKQLSHPLSIYPR